MRRPTAYPALLVLGVLGLAVATGCGGNDNGDDFSDIRATATAVASAAAASPTVDPMADYMAKASKLAADLATLHDALFADLLATPEFTNGKAVALTVHTGVRSARAAGLEKRGPFGRATPTGAPRPAEHVESSQRRSGA